MIKQFEYLTSQEVNLLLMAPVLVSVLAAIGDQEISKPGEEEAAKLAHFKTFTAVLPLQPYYIEVEADFKKHFAATVAKYTPFDESQRTSLKNEIASINPILAKLDKEFAQTLHKSLQAYAEHVKKAGRGILENFLLPLPIPGLTD
jgi:hypothetical protein